MQIDSIQSVLLTMHLMLKILHFKFAQENDLGSCSQVNTVCFYISMPDSNCMHIGHSGYHLGKNFVHVLFGQIACVQNLRQRDRGLFPIVIGI